jgi:hypothetical protein
MAVKRMKNPNRYRCANVGCGIIADKGKMLPKCKPMYLVRLLVVATAAEPANSS